jgi:predicted nucleic acid-binding protein
MSIKVGDVLFLDTNVLLTATDELRPQHAAALGVLGAASRSGVHLGLSGQILREYLVVATRPAAQNGLGLRSADALQNVAEFRRRALLYAEDEAVSNRLGRLVGAAGLHGKRIHDANVAATMLTHGVATLVTENADDFTPFPEVGTMSISDALRALAALALPE